MITIILYGPNDSPLLYIYIILCLISVSATPSGWVMPIL